MTAVDYAELKRVEGEGKSPVYTAAYDTIRKGAPGLSDATCAVLAMSINMKVAIKVTAPLLSEIEGLKAERDHKDARLEYLRTARDAAHDRAQALYMALAEVKEQVVTYPLSDNSTCMCGAPLGGHNVGSGHAPVSLADHAISLIVEAIDKALRFGAPTDGRPDDYEGPDVGMHDTEISERDDD